MIPLTPELEKSILEGGGKIHYVSFEEFLKLASEGNVLTNEQIKEQFGKLK